MMAPGTTFGMDNEEFQRIAEEEWAQVPLHFAEQVRNVALLIEDEPDEEVLRESGLRNGDTLLGLYRGIPLTQRGEGYGLEPTLPDTISLYMFPILDEALSLEETPSEAVRTVVRETIWHELAHYFGHNEAAVQEREEEGTNEF